MGKAARRKRKYLKRQREFFAFMGEEDRERCEAARFSEVFKPVRVTVLGSLALVEESRDSDRVVTLVSEVERYLKDKRGGEPSWSEFKRHSTFVGPLEGSRLTLDYFRRQVIGELRDDLGLSGYEADAAFSWITYDGMP